MTGGPAVRGLGGRLGFAITVPESWYELDLQPASREESIRLLVEDRVRGSDEMWAQRRPIAALATRYAAAAYDAGATYAACFVMPTDDGPITGSVTVSLVEAPSAEGDEDVADLLARLARQVPRSGELDPYSLVTVVEIPTAGRCARSYGIEDARIEGGYVRTVFMQTAVPVAVEDGPDRVLLISASSPVVPLWAELHDLFDAVTGTFRLVPLGDRAAGGAA